MEASAINQPHTDDPSPDEFFDPAPAPDGEAAATEAEQPPASPPASAIDPPDEPEPEPAPAEPEPAPAEPEPAPAEPPAAPPEPPAAPAPGEGDVPPASPPATEAGASNGNGSNEERSGAPTRNYVVLRELTLTPDVLRKLLEEAESSNAGEHRKGYFVLEKIEARNVKHALGAAFNNHNERIGQKPRLAAVPERAWQVKTVEPQQRTVASLSIS